MCFASDAAENPSHASWLLGAGSPWLSTGAARRRGRDRPRAPTVRAGERPPRTLTSCFPSEAPGSRRVDGDERGSVYPGHRGQSPRLPPAGLRSPSPWVLARSHRALPYGHAALLGEALVPPGAGLLGSLLLAMRTPGWLWGDRWGWRGANLAR